MKPRSKMQLFILLGIAVAVCAAAPAKKTAPEEILARDGVEYAYPHLSKDAKSVLFQSNASGRWRICTMSLEDRHPTALTPDSVNCYFPDWSPDNTRICFVSDRTGNEEIYVMDADGSHERSITANGARNIHPYWAPDGKAITFSSTLDGGMDLDIYRIVPDGGAPQPVLGTANEETCARVSPDGGRLTLLVNNALGLDDIFLMDLGDSSLVNLTRTPTRDGWPCWTPDGSGIVYAAAEGAGFKLFLYTLATGKSEPLTDPNVPYDECRPNVSPDGSLIVFNREYTTEKGKTNAIWLLRR